MVRNEIDSIGEERKKQGQKSGREIIEGKKRRG
jgi:hypothetical protein